MRAALALVLLLLSADARAQAVTVVVQAQQGGGGAPVPLRNAWVYAPETGEGRLTDAQGQAVLSNAGATRSVTVTAPGHTSAALQATVGAPVRVTLFAGDVTGDGAVSLLDVAALVDLLGQDASGSPLDFVPDGRLDSLDLAWLARVAGQKLAGAARAYALLDDAETPDARATALPGGARWQVLSDATAGGTTATSTPAGADLTMSAPGAAGSGFAARIAYTLGGFAGGAGPFAGMRLTLGSGAAVLDARGLSGLEFWIRGNGVPVSFVLRAAATATGGAYSYRLNATPDAWRRLRVPFSDFRQTSGAAVPLADVLASLQAIDVVSASGFPTEQGEIALDNLMLRAGVDGQIDGTVVATEGAPVPFARVQITREGTRLDLLTDAQGRLQVSDLGVGVYTVRIERGGFATRTAEVVVAAGAAATPRLVLDRLTPAVKPVSSGPVRVVGRRLETDFDGDGAYERYVVKGAAYSPIPIGRQGGPVDPRIHGRAVRLLREANGNTFRTYSGADEALLDSAAARGVRVIVGYFVNTAVNLSVPAVRQGIVEGFRSLVRRYRGHPGVLMWTLGNEQNLPQNNGNNPFWYSLAQEMAVVAYEEEGPAFRPVSINNGDFLNIGEAAKFADDASLSFVDLWASNIYQLNLAPRFGEIRTRTQKPVVLTEFGIDALDNRTRTEYESTQAAIDEQNWTDILAAADVCVGGTVFEYTDEWWKGGAPSSHDFGGYATNQHPDGFSNEEWWGLIRIAPDANGDGLDEWTPRAAYFMFQRRWRD